MFEISSTSAVDNFMSATKSRGNCNHRLENVRFTSKKSYGEHFDYMNPMGFTLYLKKTSLQYPSQQKFPFPYESFDLTHF